jgi:hypothetical protein
LTTQIDHLVVLAAHLEQGVAWCQATLGLVPGPGGSHRLFGTHNRLLPLRTANTPHAYLEIIAVDPAATPERPPPLRRWFDLDDTGMQQTLADQGPRLAHWVARVPDIVAARAALASLGLDPGPPVAASRDTPSGRLSWRLTVRDDGRRLFDGCLPTLIQWDGAHPTQGMTDAGLSLQSWCLRHPQAERLAQALAAIGMTHVPVTTGPAGMEAVIGTPGAPRRLIGGTA